VTHSDRRRSALGRDPRRGIAARIGGSGLSPRDGLGTARLTAVDAEGAVRVWDLPGVRAGYDRGAAGAPLSSRAESPGLAVDERGGRAFVVAGGAALRIAEVPLDGGAVAVHAVEEPRSAAGRLHDLVEPAVHAKGGESSARVARWLGDDVLAVTGADEHVDRERGTSRIEAFGLRLVDTGLWAQRVVDRRAQWLAPPAGGRLVLSEAGERTGVVAYDAAGRRVWSRFAGTRVWAAAAAAGRVYAVDRTRDRHRTYVLDAATGRVERTLPTARLPLLLAR